MLGALNQRHVTILWIDLITLSDNKSLILIHLPERKKSY